jgi:N-acetylneuraminate 9-O-acetyltransferase
MKADRRRTWLIPSAKVLRALLTFLLAVVYCFYADRTHAFEKMHKKRSTREFIVLSVVPFTLGLLLVRRSACPQASMFSSREQKAPAQPFLSRHQTEEWKGWMQLVILSYHYSGTSKVFWIYITIRLLVASYLFMTGFGHTMYFYRKGDYSLRRVAGVLIRLNLLNCVLPYMMRTDYQFYYFAPLVSFWFVVIYATMRIGRSRNGSLPFMFGKIIMSAIIVAVFTKVHGPLEVASAIVRYTCRLNWDVEEWRFRVSLDMFIVYVGMLAAILFVTASSSPGSQQIHSILKHQHIRRLRLALPLLSFAIFYAFTNITRLFPDKYEYNRWHPYISFIPIIAFIIIRNSHRHLRNFHSPLFAWLGRCSLETFILQFHIWMAGDAKGLLSLGIFDMWDKGKWYNFIVVTTIFIFVSWHVARATHTLTQCIIRDEGGWGGEEGLLVEKSCQEGSELPLRKSHDSGRLVLTTTGGSGQDEFSNRGIGRIAAVRWKWLFMKLWKCEDLSSRLGVMLVAMWFLNVVSLKGDNLPPKIRLIRSSN